MEVSSRQVVFYFIMLAVTGSYFLERYVIRRGKPRKSDVYARREFLIMVVIGSLVVLETLAYMVGWIRIE